MRTASSCTGTPACSVTASTRTAATRSGAGTRYRATIIGPGVTPDIAWEAKALEQYDQDFDLRMHALQKEFFADDSLCRAV